MHSTTFSVFGLAMATVSIAQTTTVSLFIPDADPQPFLASVVGSDATATTYAMQCADESNCGFPPFTLTEGPAIAAYTLAPEVDDNGATQIALTIDCSLAGTSSAICTQSIAGNQANDPGLTTVTFTGTDYTYMPVTITAGSLASGSGASSAAASQTTLTGTHSSGSATAQTTTGTGASQTGSSQATSSSSKGAAAAMVTGHPAWALGGAAAALVMIV